MLAFHHRYRTNARANPVEGAKNGRTVWTVAHRQTVLKNKRSYTEDQRNRIDAFCRHFLDPRGQSNRQAGRGGRRRRKPQGYQPSNTPRQHKRGRNNEDRLMQDSSPAGAYVHQLGKLNHRRGISNSTDYVLITRRIAGNVE
ncbi:uncharacterized protein LOC122574130 [Bombus pyrosoma]|uniref:uncharacterized protein LOC122574130 n=1 Tax=Bombus pyrosoma TaxID=396416 RepID=UPI001CB8D6F5|nr:uncharacterized protein LOC122574130 [Bombus pyrosoma]